MKAGSLFSATGKRIEYLYKHLDKDVRGSLVGAGIAQDDEDNDAERDIFQGLNLETKDAHIIEKAVSGEPHLLIKGVSQS